MDNGTAVRKFFSSYAPYWDSLYGKRRRRNPIALFVDGGLRRVLKRRFTLALDLANGREIRTILDCGCGSGQYVLDFARLGKDVTAIDFSEPMLTLTNDLLEAHGKQAHELILGDFNTLEFTRTFDMICAMGFFDYQQDAQSTLQKMTILANKKVIASFPKSEGFLAIQRKIRYKRRNCPLFLYSESELKNILSNLGVLTQTRIHDLGRDRVVEIILNN